MAKITFSDIFKGNTDSLTTAQDLIDAGFTPETVPTGTGLFNTPINRTPFSYNCPDGARELSNQGAYIVFGQVPPGTKAEGYGAKGIPADSIDLVVGRHSATYGGKGPTKDSSLDNDFINDAARIYVSRLCDIDKAFRLISSPSENEGRGLIARSGIALKADGIRVIGREGVKIVTGKAEDVPGIFGETNSLGGKIKGPAPKIELIAGNNYKNAQGAALGRNVVHCLRELYDLFNELWSAVNNLALIQSGYNSTVGISAPTTPWITAAAPGVVGAQFNFVINSLNQTRNSGIIWAANYLEPWGDSYISSTNVRIN